LTAPSQKARRTLPALAYTHPVSEL
jgi:hypothetical protein